MPASAACMLGFGYYMIDINLGKMFLNFLLPTVLRWYLGIIVSTINKGLDGMKDLNKALAWDHWTPWSWLDGFKA
jgi:hypothetical protein